MMKQKVLFFDIDGTLIWSYGGIQEIPQGVQKELKRLKTSNYVRISKFIQKYPVISMILSFTVAVLAGLLANFLYNFLAC